MLFDGKPASLTITKVANGFIVNVGNYGKSDIKEPYEKETMIFTNRDDLFKYQKEFFWTKEEGAARSAERNPT